MNQDDRMRAGMTIWRALKPLIGGRVSDVDGISAAGGRLLIVERKKSPHAGMPQWMVLDTAEAIPNIDVLVVYGPANIEKVYAVQRWPEAEIYKCELETLGMLWNSWIEAGGHHNEALWQGLTQLG